jgi:hypothetical protein
MKELKNRRNFLKLAGMVGTGSFLACKQSHAGGEPMRLGVVACVRKGETPDAVVAKVRELGLPTCQIGFHELSMDVVKPLVRRLSLSQSPSAWAEALLARRDAPPAISPEESLSIVSRSPFNIQSGVKALAGLYEELAGKAAEGRHA